LIIFFLNKREREFEFTLGNGLKIGKLATFCFIGSILAFCLGFCQLQLGYAELSKSIEKIRLLGYYDKYGEGRQQ